MQEGGPWNIILLQLLGGTTQIMYNFVENNNNVLQNIIKLQNNQINNARGRTLEHNPSLVVRGNNTNYVQLC